MFLSQDIPETFGDNLDRVLTVLRESGYGLSEKSEEQARSFRKSYMARGAERAGPSVGSSMWDL